MSRRLCLCLLLCYSGSLEEKTLLRVEDISGREDNREIQMWLSRALSFYLYRCKIETSLNSWWIVPAGRMTRKMSSELSNKTWVSSFSKPVPG